MALAVGMVVVVDSSIFERRRRRHALRLGELVGEAGRRLDREAVVGVRMLETVEKREKNFEAGPITPGFSNRMAAL